MKDTSRRRRCGSCGSRVAPGEDHCSVCGVALGPALALRRVMGESLVVALALLVLVGTLLAVAAGRLSLPWRGRNLEVASLAPTDVPTFTPEPAPSATGMPSTPWAPTGTPLPAVITHTVVSRDTLYGIAGRYGVSVASIVAANPDLQENPHRLAIGQLLRVPVAGSAAPATATRSVEPVRAAVMQRNVASPGPSPTLEAGVVVTASQVATPVLAVATHEVTAGQTITEVAQAYQMTVDELVSANPQLSSRPPLLPAGESLTVRVSSAITATLDVSGSRWSGLAGRADPAAGRLPPEDVGLALYRAPQLLAPGDAALVTNPAPLLQWSSVGVLPTGVHYVVALRRADAVDARPRFIWIASNATAVRVPADVRPPRGSRASIAWSVSVRMMGSRLFGSDEGTRLSSGETWRTFTWAP